MAVTWGSFAFVTADEIEFLSIAQDAAQNGEAKAFVQVDDDGLPF